MDKPRTRRNVSAVRVEPVQHERDGGDSASSVVSPVERGAGDVEGAGDVAVVVAGGEQVAGRGESVGR